MADNYLERHQEEYERRKAAWALKKKHILLTRKAVERPDDEAL